MEKLNLNIIVNFHYMTQALTFSMTESVFKLIATIITMSSHQQDKIFQI